MSALIAGLMIASTAIAAGTATSQGIAQKNASDREREYERDRQNLIDAKAAQENAFYRMEYYRDPMRTAEGANALKKIREYNQNLSRIQANKNVITGGTQEQVVAQQGKAMEAYAKGVSDIRARAENIRRTIGQNWMASQNNQFTRQTALDDAQNKLMLQSATNAINNAGKWSEVAQGVVNNGISYGFNAKPEGGNMARASYVPDKIESISANVLTDEQLSNQNNSILNDINNMKLRGV